MEADGANEFSLEVDMPLWEIVVTVVSLGVIIVLTIVGNVLVILSVFTYRPLRIVQNFFIVSLAVADLTVAVFVLPFNVAYIILGKWIFGIHLCQMWLTCDILCCTASILNLCAIALDRYWAITDPISYAQKRTLNRVLIMIALVWAVSILICLPPLFGWNDWPDQFTQETPCILTQERGFVIYSSAGSFFVPLFIMGSVYFKIFTATRRRLRERANAYASKINQIKLTTARPQREEDSTVSESGQNGYTYRNFFRKKRGRMTESATTSTIPSLTPPHPATITETSVAEYELSQSRDEGSSADEVKSSDVVVRVNTGQDGSQIHQFIEEKQRISLSKERRAARTLGIIMGSFVVCWLPFFLMYIILPFCPACPIPNDKLINFIVWLGYVNSSLNPIIYTIFNLEFRKAFARLLRCSRTVMI